jgi:hypothetical protein
MDFVVSNILPKMEENRLTVNLCSEAWRATNGLQVDDVLASTLNNRRNKRLELQFGIHTEYINFFHSYNALASARHLEEVILTPEDDDDDTSTYSFVAEAFFYAIAENPHHIGAVGIKRLKLEGDSILPMVRWAKISKLAMQDLFIWEPEVSLAIPLSIASNTYIQHLVWDPDSSQTTNLLNCLVVNTTLKRLTLDGSNGKSQFWGVSLGAICEESVLACQGLLVANNTLVQLELRCLEARSLDPIVQGLIESQSVKSVTHVFIENVKLDSVGALSGLYNSHKFHLQAFTLTPTLLPSQGVWPETLSVVQACPSAVYTIFSNMSESSGVQHQWATPGGDQGKGGRKRKRCCEPNQNK